MKIFKQSFFNEYNIEPNITTNKLLFLFQTKPKMRKDLPIVINIIKDNYRLFEEELYTLSNDEFLTLELSIHYGLLKSLDNIELDKIDSLKRFEDNYNKFKKCKYNEFFYNKNFDESKTKEIINKFLHNILDDLLIYIIDNIDKIKNDVLIWIINFYENNNKDLLYKLEDIISSKIEVALSKINNLEYLNDNLNFICNLPDEIFKKETIYKAFVYFVNKTFVKHENIEFINNNYIKVFKKLNIEDANKNSNVLNKIADYCCNIINTKDITYKKFKENVDILLENYIYYSYNICNSSSKLDNDSFKISIDIIDVFYERGENYYNDFFKKFNKISNKDNEEYLTDCVYSLVEKIVTGGFKSNTYKLFSNIIGDKINAFKDLTLLPHKREIFLNFIELNKNKLDYVIFDGSLIDIFKENGWINPFDIDSLLCRVYFLFCMQSDIFTNDMLEGIQSIAFDGLAGLKLAPEYNMKKNAERYFDRYVTFIGKYIYEYLSICPCDWKIDGMSVNTYLVNNFGMGNILESLFSKYKKKYDNLFKNSNKYYLKENTYVYNKIRYLDKASSIYRKAHSLYKENEYEKALNEFNKIKDYKDTNKIIQVIEEKINTQKYEKAMNLYKSHNYIEAKKIFDKIIDYKDSKKLSDKCETLEYEATYLKAVDSYKKQDYTTANRLFEKILEYKNSKEFIESIKVLKDEKIYQDAVVLINEKKYEEAKKLFKKIASYKNSKEFIDYCDNKLKEQIYTEALKLYNNKEYEEAKTKFSIIKDYEESNRYIKLCDRKITVQQIIMEIFYAIIMFLIFVILSIILYYNS